MSGERGKCRYRLLVVDDNRAIHEDFRKILAPGSELSALDSIEADLFDRVIEISDRRDFEIDSAFQGEEGLALVRQALEEKRPYSLAFIDMRMPPGWNGIETIERIWEADPQLQVVICSAYSDHSWAEISRRLGSSDRLLILKKPFDNVEILQMAYAMSRKCALARMEHRWQNGQSGEESATPIRSAPGRDFLALVQEIQDSVKLLQHSFDGLNEQLASLHNTLPAGTGLSPGQLLAELRGSGQVDRFADLEAKIPHVFSRLESALERFGAEPREDTANGENNKPVH